MTDESKLRRDAERGSRAQALLENELHIEVREKIRAALMKEWEETRPEDEKRRAEIYMLIKLQKAYDAEYARLAITGKDARNTNLQVKKPLLNRVFP